ncbi:hypothetical protein RHS01_03404 [Rhizoctonia solani]|uniref:CAP-Gly domain-containing protein n=1 Tax=Rhizoctonia solani TaxID=456999 RepID=A0A8H7IHU9_9AGAM|nr:hypothetical protein RHS01_03404 [Rhizoctonia solani]
MSTIRIHVLSPDTFSERKYDLHMTIGQLKGKLESVTGIAPESQRLTVHRSIDEQNSAPLHVLDDDSRPLGFYNVSAVEKFELTDEEYQKRKDTVLAYKQANKIGRFADSAQAPEIHVYTASPEIKPGARCKVETEGDGDIKRGVVRFVGPTKFGKEGSGDWVGVEYDEPVGKNDGSVQGERYFTCPAKHGAFVRPDRITVGDFPPIDPFADEQFEM